MADDSPEQDFSAIPRMDEERFEQMRRASAGFKGYSKPRKRPRIKDHWIEAIATISMFPLAIWGMYALYAPQTQTAIKTQDTHLYGDDILRAVRAFCIENDMLAENIPSNTDIKWLRGMAFFTGEKDEYGSMIFQVETLQARKHADQQITSFISIPPQDINAGILIDFHPSGEPPATGLN